MELYIDCDGLGVQQFIIHAVISCWFHLLVSQMILDEDLKENFAQFTSLNRAMSRSILGQFLKAIILIFFYLFHVVRVLDLEINSRISTRKEIL